MTTPFHYFLSHNHTFLSYDHTLSQYDHTPPPCQVRGISRDLASRAGLPQHVVQMVNSFPDKLHPMAQFSAAITAMQSESKFARGYAEGMPKTKYWEVREGEREVREGGEGGEGGRCGREGGGGREGEGGEEGGMKEGEKGGSGRRK